MNTNMQQKYYRFECCTAPNKKKASLTSFSSYPSHVPPPPLFLVRGFSSRMANFSTVNKVHLNWFFNQCLVTIRKAIPSILAYACIIAHTKSIGLSYRKRHQKKILKNWNNSSWYRLCLYKRCIPFNREVTIFSSHICCLGKSEIALEITKWDS